MALKESYNFAPYDARTDLGYGQMRAKFHAPRSFEQYPEEDEEIDLAPEEQLDDNTYAVVLKKILDYQPGDPYSKNKTDPFYYAGAATKLKELSTAKGMVPFPRMYKKRTQSGTGGAGAALPHGGPTYGFRTKTRPTGTKKGFSAAPQPIDTLQDLTGPEYSLEKILFGDEDLEHLDRIEKQIQLIHAEQK